MTEGPSERRDGAGARQALRAYWNAQARGVGDDAVRASTVTREPDVAALRDALEEAHLATLWQLGPALRVLDLAGGAGRMALRIAPHVREVVVVDLAEEQLAIGRREAAQRGLHNVRFVQGSVTDVALDGVFDRIFVLGVLLYLDDAELEPLAARCTGWLAPGGLLIVKEPVTTHGETLPAREPSGSQGYTGLFRPRERYAALFGRSLRLTYQSPTVAHPFPRFVRGTDGAVSATRGKRTRAAIARLTPLYVRLDPFLRRAEAFARARPALAALLADVPVLQDFYVFARDEGGSVELSVVVIAYNEEACLADVAEELRTALARRVNSFEIVLVDDGSRDRTRAIMEELARRSEVYRVVGLTPNRGIGGALRAGFDAAQGEHVTWVPADGQIGPDAVLALYTRRNEAPMLTTVYRTRADAWYRKAISASLNRLIRIRTGQVAKSGGNYLFARAAWREHGPRADDTMMLSTAFRHNLRAAGLAIVEVEIDCRARVAGHSKVLNPRAIGRTLLQLLRMR